jgi:hypothetical protein
LARVRSQVCPSDICGEQSGTRTGFSPNTSALPRQNHSANHPHFTYVFLLPETKTGEPWERLKKISTIVGIGGALDGKVLSIFFF